MPSFVPGQTVLVRDVFEGRLSTAFPQQVIADYGDEIRVLLTPGAQGHAPSLWIKAITDNDAEARSELHYAFQRRDWTVDEWTWQWTTRVAILYADRYFAIDPMWTDSGEFMHWYVNFQLPFVRTEHGIDTCDLHLDLVVKPDFSYVWKDEDEYAEAIHLGLVPQEWQDNIALGREQVLEMVHHRLGPFAEDWTQMPRLASTGPVPPGR